MQRLSKLVIMSFAMLLPALLSAQETVNYFEKYMGEILLGLTIAVALVVGSTLLLLIRTLKLVLKTDEQREAERLAALEKEKVEGGAWNQFWNRVNATVPVAHEAKVATSHEYDGIKELDNRLPPWWLYGFYFTIIFGVAYLLHYHVFRTGALQEEEYVAQMTQAEEDVNLYLASLDNLIDENNVSLLVDASALREGEALYQTNCAVCHAKDGGGGVGPNFTDQYWIHGGDVPSIFKTIKYGVPSKGMISWETQLSPKQMQQLTSFIYTLEGTVAAKPKEPQGDLFIREKEVEVDSTAASVAYLAPDAVHAVN